MQLSQKFLFDRDFDLEKAKQKQMDEEDMQEVEPMVELPIEVTYTQEELDMAKHDAYQQGVIDGVAKTEDNQNKIAIGLMDRLGQKLHNLIEQEKKREEQSLVLALQTSLHMVKKFWPKIQQFFGQKEIEDFIATSLAENSSETRIVLRVNDSELDVVANMLPRIKELQGFQGKVITLSDDNVMAGDCKIEWADGGAEKLSRYTMQQVEQLMDRVVSSLTHNRTVETADQHDLDNERGQR
jgi:flagellar assembly protein FliH